MINGLLQLVLILHGEFHLNFCRTFIVLFSISLSILFSINALAKQPASYRQNEINHLLNYVSKTSCTYERNGTKHNGQEAVKHIRKKYQYYLDDIHSTEDFIKYSATKSKMSGKHYLIHCQGSKQIKSRAWLLKELAVYRTANK